MGQTKRSITDATKRCISCGYLIVGQVWTIDNEPYHFSCASNHCRARSMILSKEVIK